MYNSLLFGQANDASVTVLQEVIGDYEKALVQKVSSEKSSVFFSKHYISSDIMSIIRRFWWGRGMGMDYDLIDVQVGIWKEEIASTTTDASSSSSSFSSFFSSSSSPVLPPPSSATMSQEEEKQEEEEEEEEGGGQRLSAVGDGGSGGGCPAGLVVVVCVICGGDWRRR
ncbi:hypothetical protein M9H77_09708 [Catharanthus roseus]|uniref:Uncharacterized protein n=1 Tax=Catharanthus roseus TaxID=4058 RepID=A0ACC0C1B4_CATRO|nr:hypothetical protein M9H77_09708 [Catharanthus roseus]